MIKIYISILFSILFLTQDLLAQDICIFGLTNREVSQLIAPYESPNGLTVFEHFGEEVGYFYELRNTCPNTNNGNPLPPGFEAYNGLFLTCDGELICNYGIDRPFPCEASLNDFGLDLTKATSRTIVFAGFCDYDGFVIDHCSETELEITLPKSRAEYPNLPGLPPDRDCSFTDFEVMPNDIVRRTEDGFTVNPITSSRYEVNLFSETTECSVLSFIYTVNIDDCGETSTHRLFEQYAFLNRIINPSECTNSLVTVYDLNGNIFLFVEIADAKRLYFGDGTLYCTDSNTLSCLETYGLVNVIDTWRCPTNDAFATICVGDPLPDLAARFRLGDGGGRVCGPEGPEGSPPPTCICNQITDIEITPKEGVISELINGQFFTVAPTITTTYSITAVARATAPGLPCTPETFVETYTIVVKSPAECSEQECICTTEAFPVCGVDGNTYGNPCLAACAGIDVIAQGPCTTDNSFESIATRFPFVNELVDETNCKGETIEVYDLNGRFFIYVISEINGTLYQSDGSFFCQDLNGMRCIANSALTEPILSWSCDIDCNCTQEFDPVCGSDGNTYGNACEAQCAGIDIIADGECSACGCTEQYEPVCGSDGITYDNSCFAICSGVIEFQPGQCDEPQACSQETGTIVFEPCDDGRTFFFVRASSGELLDLYFADGIEFEVFEGQQVSFDYVLADFESPCSIADNAIVATCIVDITDGGCPCDDVFDPVCGEDGVTYSNACEANCFGVEILIDGECPLDPGCNKETGTIFFELCDDGRNFFFVRTDNGEILDLYFDEGIKFEVFEGQRVSFDFELADFDSPCSIADAAILASCIIDITEEEDFTTDQNMPGIDDYTWLTERIDFESCTNGANYEIYEFPGYAFIYYNNGQGSAVLFDQDGNLYCKDSQVLSCRETYELINPTDEWTCSFLPDDSGGSTFNEEITYCPEGSVTINFPPVETFNTETGGDVECPPGFPCPCGFVTDVTVEPEEDVLNFDVITGTLEIAPKERRSYTVTISTDITTENQTCDATSTQSVYTIIPNDELCEGSNFTIAPAELVVYPNPATDYIQLAGIDDDDNDVRIVNLFGNVLWQNNGITTNKIDVSNFPSGIYILAVSSKDGDLRTIKFSVQQ